MSLLYLPFLLQGILMSIDEFIHQRRGLGKWERLGHPLDTLTVIVPFSFLAYYPYTPQRLTIYIVMSIFSCLFITKDEFIHKTECGAVESWIHSVLFILHPIIFLCGGFLWIDYPGNSFITMFPYVLITFFTYQILKWSFLWRPQEK